MDIDGPLNPYLSGKGSRRPDGYLTGWVSPSNRFLEKKTYKKSSRFWYNPSHGEAIKKLAESGFKPVWGTKLTEIANSIFSPLYGLPELDMVPLENCYETGCRGNPSLSFHYDNCSCLHSKTTVIESWVGDTPFLWWDDETCDRDRNYLAGKLAQPHKLVTVDPKIGLTEEDFKFAAEWLDSF